MKGPLTAPQYALANLAVGAGYAALGVLALTVAQVGIAVPVWPAAGLAFAVVYRWGWPVLPGIAVGSVSANLLALTIAGVELSSTLLTSLAVGLGAALQAWAGSTSATRAVGARSRLLAPRDILLFLLLAGPLAAVINATIGTVTQLASGIIPAAQAYAAWLTWWVGDSIGILVFGPIVLMLLPDQRETWRGRRWKIAVPSLVVAVLLLGAEMLAQGFESARVDEARADLAVDAEATLLTRLARHAETLYSIGGLVQASERVTAEEFAAFTTLPLTRLTSIDALSWNPVVSDEELPTFVEAQRSQPGLADYSVTERDASGELVPATTRPEHVIVQYIEPIESSRPALGFDIASDEPRRQAITHARDSGSPALTAPVSLVNDNRSRVGLLVLAPVYEPGAAVQTVAERRAAILGYAVGVYVADDLFADTFTSSLWDDVALRLTDVTDAANPALLSDRRAPSDPAADLDALVLDTIVSEPFEVFGRTWQLEVTPVAGDLASTESAALAILLPLGVIGIYFIQALLLLVTGLEQQARREAREQSFEATHDELTGLVNRRGFIARLEELCQREESEPASHVLLYADLDRFKAVNDAAGHEAGDRMLVAVADALRRSVRAGDTVARMGGDEFTVILEDCPLSMGERTGDAIIRSIDAIRVETPAGPLGVGVSVGLTVIPPGGRKRRRRGAAAGRRGRVRRQAGTRQHVDRGHRENGRSACDCVIRGSGPSPQGC